jgi:Tol biopolymer transport system component
LYRTAGDDNRVGIAASLDGDWLAIFNRRVLSVIPSSGGTPREIHRFEQGRYTNPEWTPDGKNILIGGRPPGEAKGILYRVPVGDGQPQEIVLQKKFWDRPSVHPDGQQIAFCSTLNYDSDADVWVMEDFLPGSEAAGK